MPIGPRLKLVEIVMALSDSTKSPMFLKNLPRMGYPPALTAALLVLFNPHDVVSYYPTELGEGENVIFHIINMGGGALHRFDFTQSEFIFQVDHDNEELEDVVDFLMSIEERLSGDELLNRLDFIEHRALYKKEYPYILKYYNYLRGTDNYNIKDEEK